MGLYCYYCNVLKCTLRWISTQVVKVEVREVVRQVPRVEVKYVEKKVPKQVIQYAARFRGFSRLLKSSFQVEKTVEVPQVIYEEVIIEVPEVEVKELVRQARFNAFLKLKSSLQT